FLDDDDISLADVFARDLFFVMQSGTGDGAATYEYGLQLGYRGKHSGAPDLNGYVAQPGLHLLGLVLIGHGPAGRFGRVTDALALGKGIELDHGSIGFGGEPMALHIQTTNGAE